MDLYTQTKKIEQKTFTQINLNNGATVYTSQKQVYEGFMVDKCY